MSRIENDLRKTHQDRFVKVTETVGSSVSHEQIQRSINRYAWAAEYCVGKEVLEVACGAGQGLGILAANAKSLVAGDYTESFVRKARNHYRSRVPLLQFDAVELPFPENSFDVVILFEAIYYLRSVDKFVAECMRVLRAGGKILIATANRDIYDFNPSPYSVDYYGVAELTSFLRERGVSTKFYGDFRVDRLSHWQKALRPVKRLFVGAGLMPRSMKSKEFLKRMVFGRLAPLPAELHVDGEEPGGWDPLPAGRPDTTHKVIFCVGSLSE